MVTSTPHRYSNSYGNSPTAPSPTSCLQIPKPLPTGITSSFFTNTPASSSTQFISFTVKLQKIQYRPCTRPSPPRYDLLVTPLPPERGGGEVLLEMLSRYNKEYEELMLRGTKEEFDTCRIAINHIQTELNLRKQSETN